MDCLISIAAKGLGNEPPGHNRFIILCICFSAGGEGDRLLFGKLILRDSSILNPLRDIIFMGGLVPGSKVHEIQKLYWVLLQQKGSRHLEEESSTNPRGDNLTGLAGKYAEIPQLRVHKSNWYVQCLQWSHWSLYMVEAIVVFCIVGERANCSWVARTPFQTWRRTCELNTSAQHSGSLGLCSLCVT